MARSLADEIREQGRGVSGALLVVGLAFVYTMETWWVAWRLPIGKLLAFATGGLVGVLLIARRVGFRESEADQRAEAARQLAVDFLELVVQSFAAAYATLFLFGIVEVGDPLPVVARMGLVQVVPLAFGAALANQLLSDPEGGNPASGFPRNVAVFALGAAFFAFPLAPIEEMPLIALQAGWLREAAIVAMTVVVVYLVLYELEFRGHAARIEARSDRRQWEMAFTAYLVGAGLSAALLWLFGQFEGATVAEAVQLVIVLAFPASVGAAAGEVVL